MRISDWSSDVCSSDLQSHVDVVHPATGDTRPVSLFLVTVAASGERKSAADRIATDPIRLREAELHEQYDRDCITYRSEEHTSELQSLMRISYAVFCLKKKKHQTIRASAYTRVTNM